MIYLDYCASAPLLPQVREQMLNLTSLPLGNPGALHQSGAQSRRILQESRRTLAQLLHVQDREFFFTSGGTESNNWALK